MADNDLTDQYNTPLSKGEEQQYQEWVATQSKATGRDVGKDSYDYDMRGWWLANDGADLKGGHLTDTFKKPNHPTFSTGSQYSGKDDLQGGTWQRLPGGQWSFTPGATNLQMFSADDLKGYFQRVEPGNQLLLPQ